MSAETVQELLGHADIQTTMRYARFVPSALQEVRRVQDAWVDGAISVGDIRETGA